VSEFFNSHRDYHYLSQSATKYLYEALDFVAQGKVKTIVETYPLAEAPKAYQRVVGGKTRFRAVLTM
jgi:D-arabinose 1-dehydrogenase-like Zn-dependent alcohol dehydrogenase